MDESKVCFVVDRHQIMIVLVDLDRRQLAFVDDVLVAQRADVEPGLESYIVRYGLAQHVEFSFELDLIKLGGICVPRPVPVAVRRQEDDKRLQDDGLSGQRSWTENS